MTKVTKRLLSLVLSMMFVVEMCGQNSVVAYAATEESGEHSHIHEDDMAEGQSALTGEEPECYEPGDVDGEIGITDSDVIYTLYHYAFGNDRYPMKRYCDFNGDGKIDNLDAIYLEQHLREPENPDYQLEAQIHEYYDPSWIWDENSVPTVSFMCGCGINTIFKTVPTEGVTEVIQLTSSEKAADCVNAGYTEWKATISVLGKEYSDTKRVDIPATGHALEGEVSCGSTRACTNTGCSYEEKVPGHSWGTEPEIISATCAEDGKEVYTCTQCGETKEVVLKGTAGHIPDYENGTESLVAGCKYVMEYPCKNCGGKVTGTEYLKHTFVAVETAATCVSDGKWEYICSKDECDAKDENPVIIPANPANHKWDDGVDIEEGKQHTCLNEGCDAKKVVVEATAEGIVDPSKLTTESEVKLASGAAVSMDATALESFKQNESVQLKMESVDKAELNLTEEQAAQIKGSTVYDISITDGSDNAVTFEGGKVTVSLPYTLGAGDDIDSIDVWYINDNGEVKSLQGTFSNGYVTFTTNHFSFYTVTRLTPAERCARYGHIEVGSHKAATCVESGYDLSKCQRCGEVTKMDVIPAKGHAYGEVTGLGCETNGIKTCSTCEAELEVVALGHEFVEETTDATCSASGIKKITCSRCEYEHVETIAQRSHEYPATPSATKKADCVTDGYDEFTCTLCKETVQKNKVALLGHKYQQQSDSWSWSEDYKSAQVTLVCANDSEHKHTVTAVVKETRTEAECAKPGSITYTATAVFNNNSYSDVQSVETEATGHKPDGVLAFDNNQHYQVCKVCKAKLNSVEHIWDQGTAIKEPTCSSFGTMTYECTVCDAEKTADVPATDKHDFVNGVCSVCGLKDASCEEHVFGKREYELLGEDCEDGILVINICNNCGYKQESRMSGHQYVYFNRVALSETGICANSYAELSCVCGLYHDIQLGYASSEASCRWSFMGYEEGTNNVSVYSCSKCGLVRIEKPLSASEKDEECRIRELMFVTYKTADGKVLLEGEVTRQRSQHRMSVTAELITAGTSCEDGVRTVSSCLDCDYVYEGSYIGHMTNKIASYELKGEGLCSKTVEVYGCACGYSASFSASGDCRFEWVQGTVDSQVHKCSVCGLLREDTWEVKAIDGCHNKELHTVVISKDGKQLLSFDYNRSTEAHDWIYELTLKDGATDCTGGFDNVSVCQTCGKRQVNNRPNNTHDAYIVKREMISQGELCGDITLDTYSCACGKESWTFYTRLDKACEFQYVEYSQNKQCSIYECKNCGAIRELYTTYKPVEGSTCEKEITNIWVYKKGEKELFTEEAGSYNDYVHDYQNVYRLLGEECSDGYYVDRVCSGCGDTETGEQLYTAENVWVRDEEIIFAGTNACGDIALQYCECACGDVVLYSISSKCTWESMQLEAGVEGWGERCTVCGIEKIVSTKYAEPATGTCDTKVTWKCVLKRGNNVLKAVEKEYDGKQHTTVASFELLGSSCEDGYTVGWKCIYCGEITNSSDVIKYSHDNYVVQMYDLPDDMCDGSELTLGACACGKYQSAWFSGGCTWDWCAPEETGPYANVKKYHCAQCDTYRYEVENGTRDPETCMHNGTVQYVLVRDGRVLKEYTVKANYEEHETEYDSFRLLGASCEDGLVVTVKCVDCQKTEEYNYSHHYECIKEKIDLEEAGYSCGGTIEISSCPCGESQYSYTNFNCDWKYIEGEEVKGELSGYLTYENICKVCGLSRKTKESWTRYTDSCDEDILWEHTLTVDGEEITYTANGWRGNHEYGGEAVYELEEGAVTCDDGVIIKEICVKCGEEVTSYSSGHIWLNADKSKTIDLETYGSVCGGSLVYYECPCGQVKKYDFSNGTKCDLDRSQSLVEIEGAINDIEYECEDGIVDLDSYQFIYKCAVTNPEACPFQAVKITYWVAEDDCTAVEYEKWLLGDAESNNSWEVLYATGEERAYHSYAEVTINETLEDGTVVTGVQHKCDKCDSYYNYKDYFNDNILMKHEYEYVNTLNNGIQKRTEVYLYEVLHASVQNGYLTKYRHEELYSDGTSFWYQQDFTYDFSDGCKRTYTHTSSDGADYSEEEMAHIADYTQYIVDKEATCTQYGKYAYRGECLYCGEMFDDIHGDIAPYGHLFEKVDEMYVCSICGLENINGASGSIVLEEMPDDVNYIIGYWNRGGIDFNAYAAAVLNDVEADTDNEIVLTDIQFDMWEAETDGITALVTDKAALRNAAAQAVSEAGYTGSYAIRISFVPVNSTDELDYSITLEESGTENQIA